MTPEPASLSPIDAALRVLQGFWLSRAVYVAAKLGIADLVRERPQTAADLAQATGTHAPSLYRVLRALASEGWFAEDEQGRFSLTTPSRALLTGAPGSLRCRRNGLLLRLLDQRASGQGERQERPPAGCGQGRGHRQIRSAQADS